MHSQALPSSQSLTITSLSNQTRKRKHPNMSIDSASAFSQTLRNVTDIKLEALSKQREAFASKKACVLTKSDPLETPDIQERVRKLLDGYKKLQSDGLVKAANSLAGGGSIENLDQFLLMAKHDPSVGTGLLQGFENGLRMTYSMEEKKYAFGDLFGRLLTEWLAKSNDSSAEASGLKLDSDVPSQDGFERIGREEMQEQRQTFEEYVFKEKITDENAITGYLNNLFSSLEAKHQLKEIRTAVGYFAKTLPKSTITAERLSQIIDMLIANNLLNDEKIETLRQFKKDEAVLNEVADVIMMHMASFESWTWGEPIALEMRRQLNGKYRVFMDEGIIEAIIVQFVGSSWTFEMKRLLKSIFKSDAWKDETVLPPKDVIDTREFFLGTERSADSYGSRYNSSHPSIAQKRRADFDKYFLSQLADDYEDVKSYYDDDKESKDAGNIKHNLLHLLTTELLINKTIYNEFTVVRSDFKWFGPSLPHTSIVTVLRFFGFPDSWISFFEAFLNTPLRFASDGPGSEARCRVRGVPISHTLSTFFGEMVLFVMDFAVNQAGDGTFLYRIHDDFWLWNHDQSKVIAGWKEMVRFTEIVGLEFNLEKTGSKCIGGKLSSDLPPGDIQWGFLKLDDVSGRFIIDQAQVDEHITELKRQLASCDSVFSWVQAWNKYYGGFFSRNFGGSAQCFGKAHVDMIIDTLSRIQNDIFPDHSSVTDYLKSVILERFFEPGNEIEIPQGWFYWPISMGGLGIINPLVHQYAVRQSIQDPQKHIDEALRNEKHIFETVKRNWETTRCKTIKSYEIPTCISRMYKRKSTEDIPFPRFEVIIHPREVFSQTFANLFDTLRDTGSQKDPISTPSLEAALENIETGPSAAGRKHEITNDFREMSVYWKWIVALYAEEMVSSFGGLEVVKKGLLPVGMVEAFRRMRVKWEQ